MKGKIVLLRIDANVPITDGEIQDPTRIEMSLPSIMHVLNEGGQLVIMSHLGRPGGRVVDDLSLGIVARYIEEALDIKVPLVSLEQVEQAKGYTALFEKHGCQVMILENLRFYSGEEGNDMEFAKILAGDGEVYINDAFSASHRNHASIVLLPTLLKEKAQGYHFEMEHEALSDAMTQEKHPMCIVMGGAKVDTKIGVLERFVSPADAFLLGGGLANTFLAAQGYEVGESYYQREYIERAQTIMLEMEKDHDALILPVDMVVSDQDSGDRYTTIEKDDIYPNMHIYDIGPKTVEIYKHVLSKAKTIIWNGPMGLVEHAQYMSGTKEIAKSIAANKDAYTILGGGDTIQVLEAIGLDSSYYDYVSTSGGAMLEYMEKGTLPGIDALK